MGLKDLVPTVNYYLAFPSINARLQATSFLPFFPQGFSHKSKKPVVSSAEKVQFRCQGQSRAFLTPAVKWLKKKKKMAAIVMLSFCNVNEPNKNISRWIETAYVLKID